MKIDLYIFYLKLLYSRLTERWRKTEARRDCRTINRRAMATKAVENQMNMSKMKLNYFFFFFFKKRRSWDDYWDIYLSRGLEMLNACNL